MIEDANQLITALSTVLDLLSDAATDPDVRPLYNQLYDARGFIDTLLIVRDGANEDLAILVDIALEPVVAEVHNGLVEFAEYVKSLRE
jgi:hypothetical protein